MTSRDSDGFPHEAPLRPGRWQMVLIYASGSFGFGFQSMTMFLLPLRARELGAPLPVIGLIISAGSLVPALLAVPSGVLIDRFGARRAFIFFTACTSLTTLVFALTSSYWALGALQLVNGFFRSSGWVASQTYVTGIGAAHERPGILGRFSFSANLGSFVGPTLTGVAADLTGYRLAFVVVALIGACYPLIGLVLPEWPAHAGKGHTGSARADRSGWRAMIALLRGRSVQTALVLTCVRLWSPAGWQPFFQIFLHDRGFRPTVIGTVLSASSAAAVPTTLLAGRLARITSKEVATAAALALGAIGVAISPFVGVMPFVYLPSILLGAANGVSLPLLIALMADDAPPGQLGVALGLRTGVNQVAAMVAPIASGALVPSLGLSLGFGVSSAIALAGLAGAMWLKISRPMGHRSERRTSIGS